MTHSGGCRGTPTIRGVAFLLAMLVPLSACYRTVPLEDGPQPGMRVMAALSREGTERMADRIGPDIVRVQAEAGAFQPGGWELRMISAWDGGGKEYPWARESVTFPHEYISRIERRELDRRRSWLVTGAITAAALVLGRTYLKDVFGEGGKDGGTDPVQ